MFMLLMSVICFLCFFIFGGPGSVYACLYFIVSTVCILSSHTTTDLLYARWFTRNGWRRTKEDIVLEVIFLNAANQ